ncbi:MAG: DUF4097 family beta strand repeat-containing protein [Bryobacteraceae bacterium]|jgi:DUF4097 and DUF4098 domain-containing protein YvlB
MRAQLLLPALGAALICLSSCDIEDWSNSQRYQKDFYYSYPLKSDGWVTIESFNGSVEISGWDQNTVDISGVKSGPTQEAADTLKIEIENSPEEISVRAVRPSDRRGNLGARFVVKIPRGARLDRIVTSNGSIRTIDGAGPARLRTSNGSIHVQDLAGSLDAQTSNSGVDLLNIAGDATVRTSNGHIRAEGLRGSLDANTSNAGIEAKIGETVKSVRLDTSNGGVDLSLPANFSSDLRVTTSNSSITVRMPSEPNARLVAHTSNASITSDFGIRMQGRIDKNHVEGALGNGGALIDLGTSNGGIRLLRM